VRKIAISRLLPIFNKMMITVLSICVFSTHIVAQENKPVIGVLGLDNGGGVGEATIDTLCNRISLLVEKSSKYLVLQRDFIPIVLQEQGFTITNEICSSIEGLAAAGLLLSADEVIGGSLIKNGDGITLELIRIRVSDKAQVARQKIATALGRQDFINFELPKIVDNILSEPVLTAQGEKKLSSETHDYENNISGIYEPKEKKKNQSNKHKKRAISFLTAGLVVGAAAVTGVIYYLGDRTETLSEDVPLGTLPQRNY